MRLEDCIKRIDRYMHSSDYHPRLVNVHNCNDMNALITYFKVGNTIFKNVEDYANSDGDPSEAALFHDLRSMSGCVFITGFTSHYKLLGEVKIKELLKKLISITSSNLHAVIVCYQCEQYLKFDDVRYSNWIYDVEGDSDLKTQLVFSSLEFFGLERNTYVIGIEKISSVIEKTAPSKLYVITKKTKSSYEYSLYGIEEQTNVYDLLCMLDPTTNQLREAYGTKEQWQYAIQEIKESGTWASYANSKYGNTNVLELVFQNWNKFDENTKWMYFLLLKLYGTVSSWCLSYAINEASSINDVIPNIYQSLLSIEHDQDDYWVCYDDRKRLILEIGISEIETANYCSWVVSKGMFAIYYLSDMSEKETDLIFEMLDRYALEYTNKDILKILKHVYPDLYMYLQPYNYKNELLNKYFEVYKYQKVINKIFPEFMELVEQQAIKREYNLLLPYRSEKTEAIDLKQSLVIFVDAMGVEYLSYIVGKCREKQLLAYTTLCHCDIPSITSLNKDFISVFEQAGATFMPDKNGIKTLDEIKHHGEEKFEDGKTMLPSYLTQELRILKEIVEVAHKNLYQNKYDKVVLISDHGASRLSVLSGQENKHEMLTNGIHSGRCCPKVESDVQPECAIEGNGFWVLANYDRFKGGRKANVEVHGGATLEEVVIPIIEITKPMDNYEIILATSRIKFSRRKMNAVIKLFSKTKIDSLNIRVNELNKLYVAESLDGQNYIVNLPELKNTGEYSINVYLEDNLIVEGLKLYAENSDFKEKDLL